MSTGAAGAGATMIVAAWAASGAMPLVALIVIGDEPTDVGVPLMSPVLGSKVNPGGRLPVIDSVGVGTPVDVTVKL